jgi:enoyl-CoA hydratase
MQASPAILLDRANDGVAIITLNRPKRLNALTHTMVAELHDTFAALARDRACRVVVLTGAGRGFCAGLDLIDYGIAPGAETADLVDQRFLSQQHIASLIPRMRAMPQPIIAAVNGAAAGGGLALALGADIRIASRSAKFNVAFVKIGLSGCDIGVSWLLPRLIGASRAFELMLTGRFLDASEADRVGLVSRVVDDGEVVAAALQVASQIIANSRFGVWMTKEVMYSNLEIGSLQAAIDLENRTQILATFTGGFEAATRAFGTTDKSTRPS